MVLTFLSWNISFKACNITCIMPRFGKKNQFLLSGYKIKDVVNFEDKFLHNFSCYQKIIYHPKSVILIALCLILTHILFLKILLGGLRVNYSVNIENNFKHF